jgi:hypothetical protein
MRECICAKEQVIYTDSSVAPLRAPLRSSPPPEEGLREAATQSLPTTPPSLRIDLVLVPRSLVSDTRESQSRGARPSMMHDMMHDGNDLFGTYQLTGQDAAPLCSALCDFSATTSANPYTHPLWIALNRQQYIRCRPTMRQFHADSTARGRPIWAAVRHAPSCMRPVAWRCRKENARCYGSYSRGFADVPVGYDSGAPPFLTWPSLRRAQTRTTARRHVASIHAQILGV